MLNMAHFAWELTPPWRGQPRILQTIVFSAQPLQTTLRCGSLEPTGGVLVHSLLTTSTRAFTNAKVQRS